MVLLPSPHHPFLRCLKLSRCTKLHSDVPDLNVGRSVFLLSFLSGSIHSQVSGTWVEPSGIFTVNSNLHFLNCFLYFFAIFIFAWVYLLWEEPVWSYPAFSRIPISSSVAGADKEGISEYSMKQPLQLLDESFCWHLFTFWTLDFSKYHDLVNSPELSKALWKSP